MKNLSKTLRKTIIGLSMLNELRVVLVCAPDGVEVLVWVVPQAATLVYCDQTPVVFVPEDIEPIQPQIIPQHPPCPVSREAQCACCCFVFTQCGTRLIYKTQALRANSDNIVLMPSIRTAASAAIGGRCAAAPSPSSIKRESSSLSLLCSSSQSQDSEQDDATTVCHIAEFVMQTNRYLIKQKRFPHAVECFAQAACDYAEHHHLAHDSAELNALLRNLITKHRLHPACAKQKLQNLLLK